MLTLLGQKYCSEFNNFILYRDHILILLKYSLPIPPEVTVPRIHLLSFLFGSFSNAPPNLYTFMRFFSNAQTHRITCPSHSPQPRAWSRAPAALLSRAEFPDWAFSSRPTLLFCVSALGPVSPPSLIHSLFRLKPISLQLPQKVCMGVHFLSF